MNLNSNEFAETNSVSENLYENMAKTLFMMCIEDYWKVILLSLLFITGPLGHHLSVEDLLSGYIHNIPYFNVVLYFSMAIHFLRREIRYYNKLYIIASTIMVINFLNNNPENPFYNSSLATFFWLSFITAPLIARVVRKIILFFKKD